MIQFKPSKWEGLDGMGENELQKLRRPAERAVVRAARHYTNAVKKTLTGKRSGRIYQNSRGRKHQASAPGEPPATMKGKLRQSIAMGDPVWDGWNVMVEVGSSMPYAARLEWGGVDSRGVRILPRPYWEPTALQEMHAIERILEELST